MASSSFFEKKADNQLKKDIRLFSDKLKIFNDWIDDYRSYLDDQRYGYFKKHVAQLQSQLKEISTAQNPRDKLNDLHIYFDDLAEKINNYIKSPIMTKRVSINDSYYNQKIERLCFRSDTRPYQEIFKTGFSKVSAPGEYGEELKKRKSFYPELRISSPFEAFQANTVSFSNSFESAAFFPEMMSNFRALGGIKNYLNRLEKDPTMISTIDTAASIYNVPVEVLLKFSHADSKTRDQLFEAYTQSKLTDEIWIYVTYVKKGFNVHNHGYQATQKDKEPPYGLFFSQEICSDEIPGVCVLAAFHVERDFNKTIFNSFTTQSGENHTNYEGTATFKIKELVFNKDAIKYFQDKLHRDVKKDMALLEKYKKENQDKNGGLIHLSQHGYKKTEELSSPTKTMKGK